MFSLPSDCDFWDSESWPGDTTQVARSLFSASACVRASCPRSHPRSRASSSWDLCFLTAETLIKSVAPFPRKYKRTHYFMLIFDGIRGHQWTVSGAS